MGIDSDKPVLLFMSDLPLPDRSTLRQQMRQRRRALSTAEQKKAAHNLLLRMAALPEFLRARRIALYLPNDGEIDPQPLIRKARSMGKQCYLPVLQPFASRRLWFVRYRKDTPMVNNRFGIPEPQIRGFADQTRNRCHPKNLDLVLLPLVAFDRAGGRMGMGGGFYDTTFAFTRQHRHSSPLLIGLAHQCQMVERLPTADWDIPLHAVVTDQQVHRA